MSHPTIANRWRRWIHRGAPLILVILGAALPACLGDMAPPEEAPTGEAAEAISCVTVQNVGPTTTLVDDAQIVTDPADPTRANTNYGAITLMNTGFSGSDYRRILIKFDLAGAGVPAGSTVTSATITMRMSQSLGKNPVDVYGATAPWSETAVTWNQMAAAPNGGLGALQSTIPTLGVPNVSAISASLDASLVTTWIDPALNYGLVLDHPLAGRTTLGASEAAPASRPSLQVCYAVPSCSDGVQNQGEAAVDCGGPCAACATCSDGLQNQGEAGVDCGGPCSACATCSDGLQNQGEAGIDCGGPCAACATCSDGLQNQGEAGVDCGGPCAACGTCSDGVQNQGEAGADCGGPCAACVPPSSSPLLLASSGEGHTIVLQPNGTVNVSGVPVPGLGGVAAVAAGGYHSLAITSAGDLWAWGGNSYGEVGVGNTSSVPSPTLVLTSVAEVDGGLGNTIALKTNGTVWIWGQDFGEYNFGAVPTQVAGLSGATSVSASDSTFMARRSDGTLWAWGFGGWGNLGNGAMSSSSVPVQVSISNVKQANICRGFGVALKNDDTVWVWGRSMGGELGPGVSLTTTPTQFNVSNVVRVECAAHTGMALTTNGTIMTWGWGSNGELGNGAYASSDVAVQVPGLSNVVKIRASRNDLFASTSDGKLWAWGYHYGPSPVLIASGY